MSVLLQSPAAGVLLLATAALALSSHPPSPCPRIFSYEGREAELDRWYGVIRLYTSEQLIGMRLDVQLDEPAKILGNWEGEVSTQDSTRYTILNLNTRLRPGAPKEVRIFVRFGETDIVPRVRSIALNGRRICPEDGNRDVLPAKRPDPEPPFQAGPGVSGNGNSGGGGIYGQDDVLRPSRPGGGSASGGGGRPPYSGADPLSNEGGPIRTTPSYPVYNGNNPVDPYGDRTSGRPAVEDPYDRDRTTRRTTPQDVYVPSGNGGNRRPEERPSADRTTRRPVVVTPDPYGGGVGGIVGVDVDREDRTTRRPATPQVFQPPPRDPYDDRRTTKKPAGRPTASTTAIPFHNVWHEEEDLSSARPVGSRPSDAEWITTSASRPQYTTTARPQYTTTARPHSVAQTTTRRTTKTPPSHDDGSVRCGTLDAQATPLVTNGQRTSRGQWPWHAALYQSKGIDLSYKCGGSLISKNTVITAAHCVTSRLNDRPVEADTLVIFLGKYHLKLWSEGGVQDKQVSTVYVNPAYNSSNFNGDIAILILTSPVDFTTFVRPVCLWGSANTDIQSLANTDGYVVGWGFDESGRVTEELMMAKMPVVSQQTCLYSNPQFFSHFTSNMTYCAGFKNGTSVCNGDSGGGMVFPMTTRDGTRIWQLRGIVSISVSKEDQRVCDTRHFVVFTDVAKYLDWIRKYIK